MNDPLKSELLGESVTRSTGLGADRFSGVPVGSVRDLLGGGMAAASGAPGAGKKIGGGIGGIGGAALGALAGADPQVGAAIGSAVGGGIGGLFDDDEQEARSMAIAQLRKGG